MARLKELGKIKTEIGKKLITNSNIVKALTNSQSNFLDYDPSISAGRLIYSQIFPYRFVSTVSEEQKTYIFMEFRDFTMVGNSFKSGYVYFHVVTYSGLMKTSYEMTRSDYILSEIDSLFNQLELGIGKLEFNRMSDAIYNENMLGGYSSYKMYNFN